MTKIKFKELGVVEYSETHDAMMELIESQPSFHSIWSLEHFPVFTIGISEKEITEDRSKSPPFIKTDRGGKTTFHAVSYTHLRAHETPEHRVCRRRR